MIRQWRALRLHYIPTEKAIFCIYEVNYLLPVRYSTIKASLTIYYLLPEKQFLQQIPAFVHPSFSKRRGTSNKGMKNSDTGM